MPFDLIATHTQIELGQDVLYTDSSGAGKGSSGASTGSRGSSTVSSSMAKPTVFARLSQIYHKQGIRGLYIGVVPRMLRVVPACAIMISAFEYSKSFFFRYNLDLKHAGM